MDDNNKAPAVPQIVVTNPDPELMRLMKDFMRVNIQDIDEHREFMKFNKKRLEDDQKRFEEQHKIYLAVVEKAQEHRELIKKEFEDTIKYRKVIEEFELRKTEALESIAKCHGAKE
jgi:phosphoglycerate-specific signal transduction histidine kinase